MIDFEDIPYSTPTPAKAMLNKWIAENESRIKLLNIETIHDLTQTANGTRLRPVYFRVWYTHDNQETTSL